MAIDTLSRRASVAHYVLPDVSGIETGDRATVARIYSGLFDSAGGGGVAPTISIDQGDSIGVQQGNTQQLSATVTGDPSPSVGWATDNAPVATVNASGLVSAVAVGSATITATATNASGSANDIIVVNVYAAPAGGAMRKIMDLSIINRITEIN